MQPPLADAGRRESAFEIPLADGTRAAADLLLPDQPFAVAVLALEGISSRRNTRNLHVARLLRDLRVGTLILDPPNLSVTEPSPDNSHGEAFAARIVESCDWLRRYSETASLPVGCLGEFHGAATALLAAAKRPEAVDGLVLWNGDAKLDDSTLAGVVAPTLFVVGARELPLVNQSREALGLLGTPHKRIEIVPGASSRFEEPGALAAAAVLAANWFARHLAGIDRAIAAVQERP